MAWHDLISRPRRTLAAGVAASMLVLGPAAAAHAGANTDYIETTDARHGGGAIFRANGDELTVCDQAGDSRGAQGRVWVYRDGAWHFWYEVRDPTFVGDNGSCALAVYEYGRAAIDYNDRPSRNIPEGARVSIDVCLYWDSTSYVYCNEDEGVA
jgi:hypothetical protein